MATRSVGKCSNGAIAEAVARIDPALLASRIAPPKVILDPPLLWGVGLRQISRMQMRILERLRGHAVVPLVVPPGTHRRRKRPASLWSRIDWGKVATAVLVALVGVVQALVTRRH